VLLKPNLDDQLASFSLGRCLLGHFTCKIVPEMAHVEWDVKPLHSSHSRYVVTPEMKRSFRIMSACIFHERTARYYGQSDSLNGTDGTLRFQRRFCL